jgi:hypothetical protein
MSDKRSPWQPGEVAKGEGQAEHINGHPSTLNANQSRATPRDDLSWIWERYFEHAPKGWKCVQAGSGIAYTAQGHMNIHTWRLAVPGGWLYKVTECNESHHTVQICFVPHPSPQ